MATALAAGGLAAITSAAKYEQTEVAFTNMLGSGEAAQAMLKDLTDFAAATPFEVEGLQDSSRLLLAFGFSAGDILPMMTDIGNAVAGLGGGAPQIDRVVRALGQMQAKGKVSTQELMQMAELGIPAMEYLAQAMGVDVATAMKQVELGAVDAQTGIAAVRAGMAADFGGMMADQSATVAGRWSTFKDNLAVGVRDIGTKLIEAFNIGELIEKAGTKVGELVAWVQAVDLGKMDPVKVAAFAGAFIGLLAPALITAATAAWAMVAPLIPFIAAGAAIAAVATLIAEKFGGWGVVLATVKQAFTEFIAGVTGDFSKLSGSDASLMTPLVLFGEKVREVFNIAKTFVTELWANLQPLRDTFAAMWANLQAQGGPIMERFKAIWADLQPVLQAVAVIVGAVLAVAMGLLSGIITGVLNALSPLMLAFQGLIAIVVNVFKFIVGVFTGDGAMIKEAVAGIGQGIVDVFGGLLGAVVGFLVGFVEGVVGFFTGLYDTLVGHSVIPDMVNGIVEWIAQLPERAMAFVASLVERFVSAALNMKDRVVAAISALVDGAVAFLEGLPAEVERLIRAAADAALGVASVFLSVGHDLMQGLINGIRNNPITNAIRDIVQSGIQKAKDLLGIKSPSTVFAGIGTNMGLGLVNGMEGMAGAVAQAARSLVPTLALPAPVMGGYPSANGTTGAGGTIGEGGAVVDESIHIENLTLEVAADRIRDIADLVDRLKVARVELRMAGGTA